MKKKDMVQALIDHYSNGNKAQFASLLGVKPQTVNSWISRDTFDMELIYANCVDISPRWLLSGEGEMIVSSTESKVSQSDGIENKPQFYDSQGAIYPLIEMLRSKDDTIREQAEEIGRLRERIQQLEKELRGVASDVQSGGTANVG